MTETSTPTAAPEAEAARDSSRRGSVRIEVGSSTLVAGAVCAVLVVVSAVLAVLLVSARGELDHRAADAQDRTRAEQVARDYAVGAATVDHENLGAWLDKLKAGTTPELTAKFDATAPTLQEILAPLRWESSAAPLAAVVTSESDGVYVVEAFVEVTSTSAQNTEGARTTVTYTVTVDENAGWKITDVGGLDGAVPTRR